MMDSAPLFTDVADGPEGGRAVWTQTADGLRIRLVYWPLDNARGTVLLFTGRTEYAEKYGRAAADLAARGYATVTLDWRGQGLSDRVTGDPALGHVAQFSDYQLDVQALMAALPRLGAPEPLFLLAHSMGGCIGLRALHMGLPVNAAAFTAPMWGIELSSLLRPIAWVLSEAASGFGLGETLSPGTRPDIYVLFEGFLGNKLTNDAEMYAYMQQQARAHPELMIGGPTMKWLNEALHECKQLARLPAPPHPGLAFLGTDEGIVSARRILDRMASWPGGRIEIVEGAKHEVMMEGSAIRAVTFDTCAGFFDAHQAGAGPVLQSA